MFMNMTTLNIYVTYFSHISLFPLSQENPIKFLENTIKMHLKHNGALLVIHVVHRLYAAYVQALPC